jgi:hypothetical protein
MRSAIDPDGLRIVMMNSVCRRSNGDTLDIEAAPKWQVTMFLLLPYGMHMDPSCAKICPIDEWAYKPLLKPIESISKVHQNPFRSRKRD